LKGIPVFATALTLLMAVHQACTRPQAKAPQAQPQAATASEPAGQTAAASQVPQSANPAQASKDKNIFNGEGVVEGVDKSIDTIQINHGDIKGYMPAMSMPYHVKDKSMLDLVKPGDKISFTLEDTGRGAVLIEIKKATK